MSVWINGQSDLEVGHGEEGEEVKSEGKEGEEG